MIDNALGFVRDKLNQYLAVRNGQPAEEFVVLSNIVDANANDTVGLPENRIIQSLVFVEEDRTHKSQDHYLRTSSGPVTVTNPALRLNLYVLFAANYNHNTYREGLKQLSYTLSCFQGKNVFDSDTEPALDPEVKRIVVDLYTLPMDQQSQLWQSFGGKFLPSVMYKIWLLTVHDLAALTTVPRIQTVETK